MIIKSNNKEHDTRVVLVSTVMDRSGDTIIAAIQPSGDGKKGKKNIIANVIVSMYGKQKIQRYIEKAHEENRIIKVNPDKAVGQTVQFREALLHQDYSNNLAQYKKTVKDIIW